MLITEFLQSLEQVVPLASAGYEKDAVGLQVGLARETRLRNVLFSYEVTAEVIDEAREREANLIVAFHPLIFPSLGAVTDSTRTGSLVRKLVKADIALYVLHTAFDAHLEFGTSQLMADVLELDTVDPLVPLKQTLSKITVFAPYASCKSVRDTLIACGAGRVGEIEASSFQIEGRGEFRSVKIPSQSGEPMVLEGVDEVRLEMICEKWNTKKATHALAAMQRDARILFDVTKLETDSSSFGMGAVGEWETAKSREDFLQLVEAAFGTPALRYNAAGPQQIRRVAVLGGAGMGFYGAARNTRADAFVTADVRYHDFYRADHDNILLVDAGHAETERFVTRGMEQAARKALAISVNDQSLAKECLLVSTCEPNSVRYYSRALK